MAAANVQKLRLYEDTWNAEGMTDENSLSNALLTQPDVISPVLTYLAGREDRRFPLSFLTEGTQPTKYINDIEYDFPVMGRLNKAVTAIAVSGTGAGHARFHITFKEKWFVKQYVIESPQGIQMRVQEDPREAAAGGWDYTVQLVNPDTNASVAASDIVGKDFVSLFAPVSFSGSRGNESNWVAPSKVRNQITMIRKSYRFEGNMPNKVVNIELPDGNGGTTKLWMAFEEYQHMLTWKENCEYLYWFSQYNRDKQGIIHLKDDNGKVIPIGSGVLDQIPNYDTYSTLTALKLKTIVRDALYGASDAQKMNIELFTGQGGLEEFDTAMKQEAMAGYVKNTDPQSFIRGTNRSLSFGGFFTSYEHVDGHSITVRQMPLFDSGARALNSEKHPITGLALESYRMVFLDRSTYDGENNISMVSRKGREMIRAVVNGLTVAPGESGNAARANDIDGASIHFAKEAGISIRRATNCIHIECVRS